jgi:aspartyl-tRNA(Asn)/glutamyl-tRNA(Gln) amidotransferase subunit A
MDIINKSAKELSQLIRSRELTSKEITEAYIKRIKETDDKIHAFISCDFEDALKTADECDKKLKEESVLPPLFGIPIAVKDILCIRNKKVTCGSKMLENFTAPYDAEVILRLKDNGMIVLGKCNMDEFAMGSSTENSYFGPSKNPWDLERIPGGSSGGSAAAVSAMHSPISLGSDTGGSIRQPASCCGVVGLKPTYGLVSRYGLIAFASSLDQIGPFARNIADTALIMNAIAGYDSKDSTSAKIDKEDYFSKLQGNIKGKKIAIPKEYFIDGIQPEVKKSVMDALKVFENLGAIVEEVSLPHTEYCLAVYYIICTAEASSNLARYEGAHYGYRNMKADNLEAMYRSSREDAFGAEVKRRIILGTYVLSAGYYDAFYLKAQKVRTLIKKDFDAVFNNYDCIITPTAPTTAFKLGEKISDPLQMYLSDIFTISVNLAGLPAVSIPCGFDDKKLPIGLQIIGKHFNESEILNIAYAYEQNTEWHKQTANL